MELEPMYITSICENNLLNAIEDGCTQQQVASLFVDLFVCREQETIDNWIQVWVRVHTAVAARWKGKNALQRINRFAWEIYEKRYKP